MVKTFTVTSRVELSDSGEFRGVITFPEINDRYRGSGFLGEYEGYTVHSESCPQLWDTQIFLPGSMMHKDGKEIVVEDSKTFAEVLEALIAVNLELAKKAEEAENRMTKEDVEKANRYVAHAFATMTEDLGEFSYDDEKTPEENAWALCEWKADSINRVLNRLPLGADPCPFCQTFMNKAEGTCSDCPFGKEKGICVSGDDSKYSTVLQALCDLRHAVEEMYQR